MIKENNIGKLIISIFVVLILISICSAVDYADNEITVNNLNETEEVKLNSTDEVLLLNEEEVGVAKLQNNGNVIIEKPKVPLITITAKPSCNCKYKYKWHTRTFVNYCPHCHKYNALTNKHKRPARFEQELTCKYDDTDYCGVCGKEKYSWSNYRLKRVMR